VYVQARHLIAVLVAEHGGSEEAMIPQAHEGELARVALLGVLHDLEVRLQGVGREADLHLVALVVDVSHPAYIR
jgi:hypothetical protein